MKFTLHHVQDQPDVCRGHIVCQHRGGRHKHELLNEAAVLRDRPFGQRSQWPCPICQPRFCPLMQGGRTAPRKRSFHQRLGNSSIEGKLGHGLALRFKAHLPWLLLLLPSEIPSSVRVSPEVGNRVRAGHGAHRLAKSLQPVQFPKNYLLKFARIMALIATF